MLNLRSEIFIFGGSIVTMIILVIIIIKLNKQNKQNKENKNRNRLLIFIIILFLIIIIVGNSYLVYSLLTNNKPIPITNIYNR